MGRLSVRTTCQCQGSPRRYRPYRSMSGQSPHRCWPRQAGRRNLPVSPRPVRCSCCTRHRSRPGWMTASPISAVSLFPPAVRFCCQYVKIAQYVLTVAVLPPDSLACRRNSIRSRDHRPQPARTYQVLTGASCFAFGSGTFVSPSPLPPGPLPGGGPLAASGPARIRLKQVAVIM